MRKSKKGAEKRKKKKKDRRTDADDYDITEKVVETVPTPALASM